MKILAIDSSGAPASAAVAEGDVLLAEYTIRYKKTHSQTLLPMMDQIKRMIELDLDTVDAIAVAGGPGSFTGLRIGSATAKGIGLALGKPLVHVPTLEAMAYNFYGSDQMIVPMLDARRNQVFAGIYTFSSGCVDGISSCSARKTGEDRTETGSDRTIEMTDAAPVCQDPLRILMDQTPIDVRELCEKLDRLCEDSNKTVILLGDGVFAYRDLINESLTAPHIFAPAHLNEQHAGSVAARGMDLAKMGKLESAADHRPEYLRVSQAERVRAQKQSAPQT